MLVMEYVTQGLVLLVVLEHFYILVLEMFLWTTPRALKVFGFSKEFAKSTKAMAANQGLYNGFLATGLLIGALHGDDKFGFQIQFFCLSCILVAAIYGALTVKKSIIMVQGIPALLALSGLLLVSV
jgi:putative membrane protein